MDRERQGPGRPPLVPAPALAARPLPQPLPADAPGAVALNAALSFDVCVPVRVEDPFLVSSLCSQHLPAQRLPSSLSSYGFISS